MQLQVIIYKALRSLFFSLSFKISWVVTVLKLWINGVSIPAKLSAKGIPIVNVSKEGQLIIGSNFSFNSGLYYNMIGRQHKIMLIVSGTGRLQVGNNVGISCSAIVCQKSITIGDNVRIGGNCVIYDTDFHDLNLENRITENENSTGISKKPVVIENGVFIGAHSIILKGVTIGENSIIGAGSLVSKNVPSNEIWAGNPAKYIKSLVISNENK